MKYQHYLPSRCIHEALIETTTTPVIPGIPAVLVSVREMLQEDKHMINPPRT